MVLSVWERIKPQIFLEAQIFFLKISPTPLLVEWLLIALLSTCDIAGRKLNFFTMKKMDVLELEGIEGGNPCTYFSGASSMFGLGLCFAQFPTPMTWALGGTMMAVGLASAAICSWE